MKTNVDYFSILEALGDGVMCVSQNNTIDYINEKALDIIEKSIILESQVPVEAYFDIHTQYRKSVLIEILDKARQTMKPQGLYKDSFILVAQNHKKYISASISPIAQMGEISLVINFRDITQHKLLENIYIEQKNNSEAMINALPLGIIVVDHDRHVLKTNSYVTHNFGTFRPTLEKQYLGNILKCSNALNSTCGFGIACSECPLREMIEQLSFSNESYAMISHRMVHKMNTCDITKEYQVGFVKLYHENAVEIMLIIRDITEQITYEKQICYEKEKAEEANKLKNEFLSKVSHEIRTPLNGIIGMVDLSRMMVTDESLLDNLNTIKMSSIELYEIINKVIDISKIESGAFELHNKCFSMRSVFEELNSEFQEKVSKTALLLEMDPWLHQQDIFISDKLRIQQALSCFIDNGIKFTEKGGVHVYHQLLKTDKQSDTYWLEVHIIDTGIGISTEYQETLFQSFTQADGSYTRKVGGIGLSLAIAKKIIDKLGGVISCTSKVGDGTDFYFRIPLLASQSAMNEHIVESKYVIRENPFIYADVNKLNSNNKQIANNVVQSKDNLKTILLVEDDLVNQKVIQKQLEKNGFYVETALNGKLAIQQFERLEHIDLIIMDIQMPELNGIEAADIIRASDKGKKIPIIALTSFSSQEDQATIMEHKFNLFMTKPIHLSALANVVNQCIEMSSDNELNIDSSMDSSLDSSFKSSVEANQNRLKKPCIDKTCEQLLQLRASAEFMKLRIKSKFFNELEHGIEELIEKLEMVKLEELRLLAFKVKMMIRKESFETIPDLLDQIILQLDEIIVY